jgi:hypothetical protein
VGAQGNPAAPFCVLSGCSPATFCMHPAQKHPRCFLVSCRFLAHRRPAAGAGKWSGATAWRRGRPPSTCSGLLRTAGFEVGGGEARLSHAAFVWRSRAPPPAQGAAGSVRAGAACCLRLTTRPPKQRACPPCPQPAPLAVPAACREGAPPRRRRRRVPPFCGVRGR